MFAMICGAVGLFLFFRFKRTMTKSRAVFLWLNSVWIPSGSVCAMLEYWVYQCDGTFYLFCVGAALAFTSFFTIAFRTECTGAITKMFDQDQQIQDGAFASEMLDSVSKPRIGMEWWVLRDTFLATGYDKDDPRRCWKKGTVAHINTKNSSIEVAIMPEGDDATAAAAAAGSGNESRGETVTVTMSSSDLQNAEELLYQAQSNLRCVSWSAITLALLENNSSTHGAQSEHSAYSVSRPVGPSQKIDYFISHRFDFMPLPVTHVHTQ